MERMSQISMTQSQRITKKTSREERSAESDDQPFVVRTGPIARRAWSLSRSGSRGAPRARDLVRGGSYAAA